MSFDAPLSAEDSERVFRIRLFEMGHTFEYIDSLGVQDRGDIIGYWAGKSLAEERARKRNSQQSKQQGSRKGRKH